jgi:hypothetical protein
MKMITVRREFASGDFGPISQTYRVDPACPAWVGQKVRVLNPIGGQPYEDTIIEIQEARS